MPLIPRRRRRPTPTPTRQQTGTSYSSTGAKGISAPSAQELGSSLESKLVERVPELASDYTSSLTYRRMVRDDASVRVSLRAGKAPVLGAEFFIDPYDNDPQSLAIWDFVDFNLFNGMTTLWSITLSQILKMYESPKGRSIFELVWEEREWSPRRANSAANRKQYTMLRKMAYRPDATIQEIDFDNNGGPTAIIQNAIDSEGNSSKKTIPIEKAVIFVMDQEEGTLEGMPMLRSAYKHWYYKNRFYAIDGIQKERHGIGVPDIEVQPGASAADWELAKTMGKNLRTNEFAHIVRPPTLKVGFAELSGNLVNALESASHHDVMIMRNIMVDFLSVGESGSGGSRASTATAMDMFLKSMRHVADSICDAINLYVIPPLVSYNFATDNFPQIKVRNVGETKDLQMWAAAMRNLIQSGALTVDEETEQWIRDQMDMPALQTPWVPYSERPSSVTEQIQEKVGGTNGTSNGNSTDTQRVVQVVAHQRGAKQPPQDHSPNGGAGNVGVSPSSSN